MRRAVRETKAMCLYVAKETDMKDRKMSPNIEARFVAVTKTMISQQGG